MHMYVYILRELIEIHLQQVYHLTSLKKIFVKLDFLLFDFQNNTITRIIIPFYVKFTHGQSVDQLTSEILKAKGLEANVIERVKNTAIDVIAASYLWRSLQWSFSSLVTSGNEFSSEAMKYVACPASNWFARRIVYRSFVRLRFWSLKRETSRTGRCSRWSSFEKCLKKLNCKKWRVHSVTFNFYVRLWWLGILNIQIAHLAFKYYILLEILVIHVSSH